MTLGPPTDGKSPHTFRTVLSYPAIYGTASEPITSFRVVLDAATVPVVFDGISLSGAEAVTDENLLFITEPAKGSVTGFDPEPPPHFLPKQIDEIVFQDAIGNKVKVMYPAVPTWQGGTGVVRTAGEDYAANPANWVQWGWSYFDTYLQAPKTFTFYAPFGNKHCFPWVGYRVWVNVGTADAELSCYYDEGTQQAVFENDDQVMLIWPAPECFYDDVHP